MLFYHLLIISLDSFIEFIFLSPFDEPIFNRILFKIKRTVFRLKFTANFSIGVVEL